MSETMEVEEPKQPSARPQQYVSVKVMYQAVIFVSLAMSICSTVVYDRFFTTKVAVLDLPGYLEKLKIGIASKKITEDQAAKAIDGVKALVDSMPSNYIVLSGDTILGNPARIKKLQLPEIR